MPESLEILHVGVPPETWLVLTGPSTGLSYVGAFLFRRAIEERERNNTDYFQMH
jgi:hypothetical protein